MSAFNEEELAAMTNTVTRGAQFSTTTREAKVGALAMTMAGLPLKRKEPEPSATESKPPTKES